jgi:predicted metal-binding membrane protein
MSSMAPPLAGLVVMWWLMMAAMMLPSATPAILLYARVRRAHGTEHVIAPPSLFLAGYLFVWLLFSIAAAVAQRILVSPFTAVPVARSGLLLAAGLYQLSPLKRACLNQCRLPAQFISRHWRNGLFGALRLGVLHGAYCVGCCWMLMTLLFVGGAMNLVWVVGLTVIVGGEKLLPGKWLPRTSGVALVLWGLGEALL